MITTSIRFRAFSKILVQIFMVIIEVVSAILLSLNAV